MAYEKQTWTTGEVITQEKLNHMEDGIANAGGFECSETRTRLFEETVTTSNSQSAPLSYSTPITVDSLNVTFNGVEYECPKLELYGFVFYGGFTDRPTFTDYPFVIQSNSEENVIFTENDGEHTVKAEVVEITSTVTSCFREAVNTAYDGAKIIELGTGQVYFGANTTYGQGSLNYTDGKTFAQVVGGKTIVNMFADITNSSDQNLGGNRYTLFSVISSTGQGEIYKLQQDAGWAETSYSTALNLFRVPDISSDEITVNVKVYAICI